MKPKVSFITSVKNRPKELSEMLWSLVKQDIAEWEAIIVDNHSTEPVKEMVESFHEPRFRFFSPRQEINGISAARNFAVQNAGAEILLVADADDINKPMRARKIYEAMSAGECDVFYSRIEYFIDGQKERTTQFFQPFNAELLRMINFINNPSAAFRKKIFDEVGGYDNEFDLSEDYDLWLRILQHGGRFCCSSEALVEYRRSQESISIKKHDLMHGFIMKTRIKNNIEPFDLNRVKTLAIPELAEVVLKNQNTWIDDRFEK